MPPIVFILLNAFTAAIQVAPQIKELTLKAKEYFKALVKGGIITKAQLNLIDARVDAITEAALDGQFPASWDVEADPV